MGYLVDFQVKRLPKLKLIGKELRLSMAAQMQGPNRLPAFWDECFAANSFEPLEAQTEKILDPSYVGVMMDWDKGDGDFSYVVGMLMKEDASVPEGYYSALIDETDAAVAYVKGKDTGDVCSAAHALTQERLVKEGRTCDQMKWCMELYNCPRFTTPDDKGEIILDYYIPLD